MRCYRISSDAQEVLNKVRYTYLPKFRKDIRQEKDRLDKFLGFIRQSDADSTTAAELEEFVREHLDVNRRVDELETLHTELEAELSTLSTRLLEYNDDFEILQQLEGSDGDFTETELAELKPLLGLYGGEVEKRLPPGAANTEYVGRRQMYWGRKRAEAPHGTVEYTVADQAYTRYGLILDEILGGVDDV